jgi:PadR family transcriptional regulator
LTPISDLFYIVSMQGRRNQPRTYDPLGEFEALVLLAVLQLREDAYGMRVHRELEIRAGRKCSFGALYTTLDRLEEKGYVSSRIGEPTAERGGRAKKFFQVKALGSAALRQSYGSMRKMAEGLEPILGGAL